MEDKGYVDLKDLMRMFHRNSFVIWGTGIDADILAEVIGNKLEIKAYIDKRRYGNEFRQKKIIGLNEYAKEYKDNKIVIVTYRYALEIKSELEEKKYVFGEDFYIYDNEAYFCQDKITEKFIECNKRIWKEFKPSKEDDSEIIIPFDNKHDASALLNAAYISNYYAKKWNCKIKAYMRFGAGIKNVIPNIRRIYESLNMSEIIDSQLNNQLKEKAKKITDKEWVKINTWGDWNQIKLFDIEFGTTIVRHMLRHIVVPLNPKEEVLKTFLYDAVSTVLFWHDYFDKHRIKMVLLGDGVAWDGYIREIALDKGIPTYITSEKIIKMRKNFHMGLAYPNFKNFWESLSYKEKQLGIQWAQRELDARISGKTETISTGTDKNVFSYISNSEKILNQNDKYKILICPHIFEEDSYQCGEQLFDNNYISWLIQLGEISELTPEYDWYMKIHPSASKRDLMIYDEFVRRYPRIKKLEKNASPHQLKSEGIKSVLTVYGTVAYEYPLIGINVVNAGCNPGEKFGFAITPKTKGEYINVILNLKDESQEINIKAVYEFYAMQNLFYDWDRFRIPLKICDNEMFNMTRSQLLLEGKNLGTWKYQVYMNNFDKKKHEQVIDSIEGVIKEADTWRNDVFYKRSCLDVK